MSDPDRRAVLRLAGAAALRLLLGPTSARAATRSLALYAVHTGERLEVEYCVAGAYQPDGLRMLDRLLRDHRTDEVRPIDPALLDVLCALHERLGGHEPFHVISGYRSPSSNMLLRRASDGVAANSYHLVGRAVDVFLPGCDLARLRRAALAAAVGGVGYYPSTGFVHLDTGPLRSWTRVAAPRYRKRSNSGRRTRRAAAPPGPRV